MASDVQMQTMIEKKTPVWQTVVWPLTLQKPSLSDRGVANGVAKFRMASGRLKQTPQACHYPKIRPFYPVLWFCQLHESLNLIYHKLWKLDITRFVVVLLTLHLPLYLNENFLKSQKIRMWIIWVLICRMYHIRKISPKKYKYSQWETTDRSLDSHISIPYFTPCDTSTLAPLELQMCHLWNQICLRILMWDRYVCMHDKLCISYRNKKRR